MRGIRGRRAKRALPPVLLALAVVVTVVTSCTTAPPPPVVDSTPIAATSTPIADTPSQITASVDRITGGYNPHNQADLSTVTTALSEMLLPSVFRPNTDGELELDESLMTSAEVTSQDPFVVTYEIRPDASWSDGAPIAVEDFVYLSDAMHNQPGVVDPAGYRLIETIQPGAGGKRVEVQFSKPYPGWKSLFTNLLPAHVLKDAPGGWRGALADSFPTYGGPFSIKTIDQERGEIILERNERYWEKPAAVDRIVLRSSEHEDMTSALRGGNDQFALTRTDADGLKLFEELGKNVELRTVARPYLAEVLLRPSETLADDTVRAAIVALLDRDRLIEEGTGGGPSAGLRAGAQVVPPSAKGYRATMPSGPPWQPDQRKARRLLEQAGYTRQDGTWTRDGEALSLVVASPGRQEPYATIATELAEQLTAAGIEVTTVQPPPRTLFAEHLARPAQTADDAQENQQGQAGDTPETSTEPKVPESQGESAATQESRANSDGSDSSNGSGSSEAQDGTDPDAEPQNSQGAVDIAVVPQPVTADPAATLASTFGCLPGWDRNGKTQDNANPGRPANAAAFCDEELQPEIEAALTGAQKVNRTLNAVEPALWQHNVAIPLFQLADTLAIGSGVAGVSAGPPLSGPFFDAVNWTRAPR